MAVRQPMRLMRTLDMQIKILRLTGRKKLWVGNGCFDAAPWGERPAAAIRAAVGQYRAGRATRAELAARYGVSSATVSRLMQAAGVVRPWGGRQPSHKRQCRRHAVGQ
jgi:hypothetical protein